MPSPTQAWHDRRERLKRLPRHVGIIPDGNRRWADGRGLARQEGYAAGIMPGLQLLEVGRTLGIPEASVYGFTRENTRRSRAQVEAFSRACVDFADQAVAAGAAVRVFGDTESRVFPEELRALARERSTGDVRVNLLVNYSWQWDVAVGRAAGREAAPAWAEGLPLATGEVPRVELVVRWGGRRRLSGFLPLQSAYADLYVVDALWPDMEAEQFVEALEWYSAQDVTMGG
ncbi:MAG TPA: undecaprenyl diphosphate synthase family protein [Gemmatimonadaceae bacterium]|nr:undecaprenyl diphosphate synthase family protein [Gemmatimonadaceae bacterium]